MDTSNERDGLIKKAVVDMNGDWKSSIQNIKIGSGAECLFSDNRGYWATCNNWDNLCSGEMATDGNLTPICTIAEFEEAAAKWKEQQSLETSKVDLSQMYCPVNSPDIEAFKKLVWEQLGEDALLELTAEISQCHKRSSPTGVRVDNGTTQFAKLSWYQHETDYVEFKAPKVNYEELAFGELPRDEQLKLVEHVLDGGKVEMFYTPTEEWLHASSEGALFFNNKKYRIKRAEPITEKELFLREAKHYESIEQMFDSGKFKLVADGGEE
ncbi:hypothetical protein KASIA_p023 [Shewanella phage vB_SspS_KASIA]|nr:hypothetical protein KASIA_p023 [Shewanella phage vB_SspS_KASIA]